MRKFIVEVYEDNDITEEAIHIELLCRFDNMIASVKEEASEHRVHPTNGGPCVICGESEDGHYKQGHLYVPAISG